MLLQDLTREQIGAYAPAAVAVLPTASIEQHGPHLPVVVDTLLCTTVATRAAARARSAIDPQAVWVTPTFSWGSSHHHRPFPGVLSLSSPLYIAALTDIVESVHLCGFRRILILNGHGGNSAPNAIVAQDFVNRLGFPVHIAASDYWNVARAALVQSGLIEDQRIPGHAGEFETALMRAVAPERVTEAHMGQVVPAEARRVATSVPNVPLESHGAWQRRHGYTDEPQAGTAEQGRRMLEIIIQEVADAMVGLHALSDPD